MEGEFATQLCNFHTYDEKSKGHILEQFMRKNEKFWVRLEQFDKKPQQLSRVYDDIIQVISLVEDDREDAEYILSNSKHLEQLWLWKQYSYTEHHPILKRFRFVKPREYNNKTLDTKKNILFIYPKYRVIIIFKFNLVWFIIKNGHIIHNSKIREYFRKEIGEQLSSALYVLEVCYEIKRSDEIVSYAVLDTFEYDGQSLVTQSFVDRYNVLKSCEFLNVYPMQLTIETGETYLVKRSHDNMYDRSEFKLTTSRLNMVLYHLIVGEMGPNNQIKVLVAKLDPVYDKFHIVYAIPKNSGALDTNLEYTENGSCIFGNEYVWNMAKLPKANYNKHVLNESIPNVNYYKHPMAAILSLTANKLNARTQIQEVLFNPPADRSIFVKID